MPVGALCLYDATLDALLRGSLPPLEASPITALLLAPSYMPAPEQDSCLADVSAHEVLSADARRLQLTGINISGAVFHSDDLVFGDPITLGPVRYIAFLLGIATGLKPDSLLLGVADLSPGGGALEAQRGHFSVTAPASGWFRLTRAA